MYDNSIIVAADIEIDAVAEKIGARERCPQLDLRSDLAGAEAMIRRLGHVSSRTQVTALFIALPRCAALSHADTDEAARRRGK
jgi:hypothetical protein